MIDYSTGEISDLESILLGVYSKDEYKILFEDLAYIIFDGENKCGAIIDKDGIKITESEFTQAIPIIWDKQEIGYCLLDTKVDKLYGELIDSGHKSNYKPITLNVPILTPELTIDRAKLIISLWKKDIPELKVKYKFKVYCSRICYNNKNISMFV